MENYVTWEQLRFVAWLVIAIIGLLIKLFHNDHHNNEK